MSKLGIVGGIGPASTIDYYREIIDNYRKVKGNDVYPEIVVDSINMNVMISAFNRGDDAAVISQIVDSIKHLHAAGADLAAIASNTPHLLWKEIIRQSPIPLISIVEATCDYIEEKGFKKVLVLGTEFTMSKGLYDKALSDRGIESLVPSIEDRKAVGGIIYPNLENGIVIQKDKKRMIEIVEQYIASYHIDGVVLGCTEIPIMIKEGDVSVPVINTTQIHIDILTNWILTEEEDLR